MALTSPSTLMLAGVLAAPTLWRAVAQDGVSPADAATRYLISVPIAALMLAALRMVTRAYHADGSAPGDAPGVDPDAPPTDPAGPGRRHTDGAGPGHP